MCLYIHSHGIALSITLLIEFSLFISLWWQSSWSSIRLWAKIVNRLYCQADMFADFTIFAVNIKFTYLHQSVMCLCHHIHKELRIHFIHVTYLAESKISRQNICVHQTQLWYTSWLIQPSGCWHIWIIPIYDLGAKYLVT